MKQVARLEINIYSRMYNDVVLYKLRNAGIEYREEDARSPFAIKIMVPTEQFEKARKIVAGVSYTNPRY
jgi:hypothetical protein